MRFRTRHLRVMLGVGVAAVVAVTPVYVTAHTHHTSPCHLHGAGIYALPDTTPACTPGAWIDTLPANDKQARKLVCKPGYNPRPGVTVTGPLKRQALKLYGMPASASRNVELDHRYPVWLGGKTVIADLWPEPDYAHHTGFYANPKDHLEIDALYADVCRKGTVSPAQARAVFEDPDWVAELHKYLPGVA